MKSVKRCNEKICKYFHNFIPYIFFFFFLLITSCGKEEKSKVKKERVIEVSVLEVKSEKVLVSTPFKGTFKARKDVILVSQEPGIIVELYKFEGDIVKKGDILAKIDTSVIEKSIEKLKEQLRELKEEYLLQRKIVERRKELFERELIAKEDYERELVKLKTLEARVKALERELDKQKAIYERYYIKAPFNGEIAERYVSEGDYVSPQQKVFRIVATNPLEFVFKIPQKYVSSVEKGKNVKIFVEGAGNIEGKVFYISPTADDNTQITVKVLISNKNGKVKPGMYGIVEFPLKRVKAFKVPENAVALMGNKKILWKVSDSIALPVQVKVIKSNEGFLYVVGDIKEGDKIAIDNIHFLREGSKVVVR
ncbi:MAG: efflux RND transporter periplasmic adaptor subunit [Aquifex sp.]|nr:MAG: efflux RND transporter periplasmic adaptor subunit [Aquifex sp.]